MVLPQSPRNSGFQRVIPPKHTPPESKDFVYMDFPQMDKLFLETLTQIVPMLANGDFLSPFILEGKLGFGF